MGHLNYSKEYLLLQQRLDRSPQGAPASDALFHILEVLFSQEEAKLVSKLPIRGFSLDQASKIWKKPISECTLILNELADKGILVDIATETQQKYIIAPTMAGFFEFSMMRTDGKFDRKVLSELYHQYINVEEDFMSVFKIDPAIDRVLVHEDQIPEKYYSEILDYERVSHIIETATCITVGQCYCRHKMEHMGKACDNPQDVCLTFNGTAKSLSKHGIAKEISKDEARAIIHKVMNLGLVQIGDNVQEGVNWICNCCGCCCEAILAYKRLGYNPNIQSNFEAQVHPDTCTSCGICVEKCPLDAISLITQPNGESYASVDYHKCFGCGVCSRFCPSEAISMERRQDLQSTPKDDFERFILSAIDTGKLANVVFDSYHLWTHKILRRFLQIILNLSPLRRKLVDKQIQSRFLQYARKKSGY